MGGNTQGESQSVQNQKFYQSTVAAINAEKANTGNAGAGHHPPNTNKEQPDEGYTYVDRGDDKQEPAIPKAQPEVQEQPKAPEDQDTEEIPIAGRTKMTVPKGKDQDNGRAGAEAEAEAENIPTKDKEDEQEKKKQQELEDEQAKVKAELNGILKRSPSKFAPIFGCVSVVPVTDALQLSSFQNPIARLVRKPRQFS